MKKRKVDLFYNKWLSSYGTSKHAAALVLRGTVGQLLVPAEKFMYPYSKIGNSPRILSLKRNLKGAEDASQK